jgi:hypothetical protein
MFKNKTINNYNYKEIVLLFFLYVTLLISFFLGENSTGGAINDYINQKNITTRFANEFKETFLNYDKYQTRHSPILLIFLSLFEKLNWTDQFIRLVHLHLCLFLPIIFYNCLKIKYPNFNKKIFLLLSSLIIISPTFRTLSIWPDSRIFGLIFFSLSVLFFLKFLNNRKFKYAILNTIFCAVSSYISPNFSVFAIYFFINFIIFYKIISTPIIIITILNLFLAFPAIYYILILEINFFSRSAAIGINLSDKQIFFNNIFNDISLTFTYLMFYLLPFLITKIIKIKDIFSKKNLFLTILIFIPCVIYFDYNVSFSGGGIFFKASNYFFNNNFIFFIICFFSMLAILPVILSNYMNLILFLLIILNNPQYTIYHKYFDPFLIISYFLIFHLNIDLKKILILRNYSFVFFYFFLFLLISNFKYLWII